MARRKRRHRRRRSPLLTVAALLIAVGIAAALAARTMRPATAIHRATARTAHAAVPHARATEAAGAPVPATTLASTPQPAPPREASAAPAGGPPRLALIIDDCGQWPDVERGFIALPVALTLSVLPHVRYGGEIARAARAAGKAVMLHLPMEPNSGADPGPGGVTVAMDDAAIATHVRADLDDVPLAAGVNNHEGSRATSDDRVMRGVATVLAERHVFFVDSRTAPTTVAERDANAAGVPTARRDVFLDDVEDVAAIEAQLRRAVSIAQARGSAIAIGHPRQSTLDAVRALIPELQAAGVVFVPAAELVR